MFSSRVILIIIALILAGLLLLFVVSSGGEKSQPSQTKTAAPSQSTQILVATKHLKVGEKLTTTNMKWQDWKESLVKPKYIIKGAKGLTSFSGAIVVRPIVGGQPITTDVIIPKGQSGYLASLIKPGMRAVAIEVEEDSGVGGFILPGDYVDVLVTYKQRGATRGSGQVMTETLVRKALVLGIDQTGVAPADKQAEVVETVTVEVSPAQAEQIARGRVAGKITLSLHGAISHKVAQDGGIITHSSFSKPVKKQNTESIVHELRGDDATTSSDEATAATAKGKGE